jgi:hypothetical protein
MVGSTKRPMLTQSPETVPGDATLRNVFNHLAVQWLGRVCETLLCRLVASRDHSM